MSKILWRLRDIHGRSTRRRRDTRCVISRATRGAHVGFRGSDQRTLLLMCRHVRVIHRNAHGAQRNTQLSISHSSPGKSKGPLPWNPHSCNASLVLFSFLFHAPPRYIDAHSLPPTVRQGWLTTVNATLKPLRLFRCQAVGRRGCLDF